LANFNQTVADTIENPNGFVIAEEKKARA